MKHKCLLALHPIQEKSLIGDKLTKKKIGFRDARAHIESNMAEYEMSLSEAVVDFLDSHEIPIDKVSSSIDEGLFEQLKAELLPLIKNHEEKTTIYSFIRTNSEIKKTQKKSMRRIKR